MTELVALNGSPRGRLGNTEVLLSAFLGGAAAAGARTKVFYVKDLKVHSCVGCFTCWTKTPGRCVFHDDMPDLLDEIRAADIIVWATPLYFYGMTSILRTVMERMLPLSQPYMVRSGEHITHPPRYAGVASRQVLISNCGFPETHHFSALRELMRHLSGSDGVGLAGEILCACGPLLKSRMRPRLQWYLDAVEQAGREVVELGRIQESTTLVLARPLVDSPAEYARMVNSSWQVPGDEPPSVD
jgi:multimeric flavodoxin WrbA